MIKETWIANIKEIVCSSLSVSHDEPGAKIAEKMAPGPYILK